jgi:hypothetical protein
VDEFVDDWQRFAADYDDDRFIRNLPSDDDDRDDDDSVYDDDDDDLFDVYDDYERDYPVTPNHRPRKVDDRPLVDVPDALASALMSHGGEPSKQRPVPQRCLYMDRAALPSTAVREGPCTLAPDWSLDMDLPWGINRYQHMCDECARQVGALLDDPDHVKWPMVRMPMGQPHVWAQDWVGIKPCAYVPTPPVGVLLVPEGLEPWIDADAARCFADSIHVARSTFDATFAPYLDGYSGPVPLYLLDDEVVTHTWTRVQETTGDGGDDDGDGDSDDSDDDTTAQSRYVYRKLHRYAYYKTNEDTDDDDGQHDDDMDEDDVDDNRDRDSADDEDCPDGAEIRSQHVVHGDGNDKGGGSRDGQSDTQTITKDVEDHIATLDCLSTSSPPSSGYDSSGTEGDLSDDEDYAAYRASRSYDKPKPRKIKSAADPPVVPVTIDVSQDAPRQDPFHCLRHDNRFSCTPRYETTSLPPAGLVHIYHAPPSYVGNPRAWLPIGATKSAWHRPERGDIWRYVLVCCDPASPLWGAAMVVRAVTDRWPCISWLPGADNARTAIETYRRHHHHRRVGRALPLDSRKGFVYWLCTARRQPLPFKWASRQSKAIDAGQAVVPSWTGFPRFRC